MKAGLSSGLFAISILKYLGFVPDGDIIFQSVLVKNLVAVEP
ncbi:MAG: hypothetical protein Ct9H90mP20_0210 [Candidatus Neomarinimicrobiota bacterium]|nr:MAG: hypothetical protein Ct9H90mP20_0210 [Candidatus Neomarinimicrobiota bacterium]